MSKDETAAKPRKPRAPLEPLTGPAASEYSALKSLQDRLLTTAAKTTIPARYLRKFRTEFSESFNKLIAARKVDPKVAQKQKLEEKLAAIQKKIKGL